MDTLPYAPLFGTLALALLWSALFTAVEAARLQLNGTLRAGEDGHPVLPAQALVLCASLGKLLVLGLACLVGQRQSGEHGFWLAGLAATLTLLVFAEYLPRRLARRNPQAFVSLGASLLKVPLALLQPLACLLDGAAKLILRPFRAQPTAVALHAQDADDFDEDEQHEAPRHGMLDGLQSLDKITVNDILVPRNEVDGINLDEPIERIIEQLIVSRHTRLPVYRGDEENILGVVHAKDLLREVDRIVRGETGSVAAIDTLDIVKVAMKPYFIPDTTSLDEQMREFLTRRTHFALVVDEYGALQGLITLEDILEEIVGEFESQHSLDNPHIHPQADGRLIIDGAASIRELNKSLGWHLPSDGPKTLNGLVTEALETIPDCAVCLKIGRYRLEILETEDNRVSKVLIWHTSRIPVAA